ncbi:hypothetical protein LZ009_16990 [Ramlibacter sp. XY19]|uniref:hypothetical protein n=1 Tax=Ramlibacter paludis TaxID=2908000 RepID=UPI0023DBD332|nr:hypothetical protein [Ramlibacter paludis]MCG2594476.1 hypothetical protein [Ramlibacter paludis]
MQSLLTLLPLTLSVALMTALVKLAARLYRRTNLSWLRAFGYVILLLVGSVGATLIARLGGNSTPLPLALAFGLAAHLLLGGWYFGRFAYAQDGNRIGFPRGAILGIVFAATLAGSAMVPALVLLAVRS